VIAFLRFIGILNAAVWCGATLFTIICVPALFSEELRRLLTDRYVGFPAEAILARYFIVQYWCCGIALAHLAAEWLYLGRSVRRVTLGLLVGLACLGLIGGLVLQPKLRQLHIAQYWGATAELRVQAGRAFKIWHGVAEGANVLVAGGVIVYLWRVSKSTESSRFVGLSKIRS
jgi:hypothetical protein